MATLETLADVERVLGELADRGYARRLGRRPGQKEDRFAQLLGGGEVAEEDAVPDAPPPAASADPLPTPIAGSDDRDELEARVTALESEVAALRAQLAELLD